MGNICCKRYKSEEISQGENEINIPEIRSNFRRYESPHDMEPTSKLFNEGEMRNLVEMQDEVFSSSKGDGIDSSGYSSASTAYTCRETRAHIPSFSEEDTSLSLRKRGLKPEHARRIKTNFRYLKQELDVDCGLLDYFIQENIFSDDQIESIESEGSRRRKVDCLLRMLLRSRQHAFDWFMEFLTATDCDHVRHVLESETLQDTSDFESCTVLDSLKTLNAIEKHKAEIIDQLEPDRVADFFIQYEEFTIDEYESIISQLTRRQKAEKLMEVLSYTSHMPRGYNILLKALTETEELYLLGLIVKTLGDKPAFEMQEAAKHKTSIMFPRAELPPITGSDEKEVVIKMIVIAKTKNWTDVKRQKRQLEENIVQVLNEEDVQFELNDFLISDTQCLIKSVEKGSIIIRIKGCGQGSLKKLMEQGCQKGIERILNAILSHPKVRTHVIGNTVLVTDVDCLPTENDDITKEEDCSWKGIISTNRAFLIEELDPIIFMQLGIFTKHEEDTIRLKRQSSRAKATKTMLDFLLSKSERERYIFISELKERKEFVWKHICPKAFEDAPEDFLFADYEILVEHICPSQISELCLEEGLLTNFTHFAKTRQRSDQAKYILQEIMKKGYAEKDAFLRIISTFDDRLYSLIITGHDDSLANEEVEGKTIETPKTVHKVYEVMRLVTRTSSTNESEKLQDNDDHKLVYKTEISISKAISANEAVEETVVKETECKDDGKRANNENDNESGYESLSLNRRTEMLEQFTMPV